MPLARLPSLCATHRSRPIPAAPCLPLRRHWESYAKAEIRQLRRALEAQQQAEQQQQQQQQEGGS